VIEETLLAAEEKMDRALEVAEEAFSAIRTGRASAAMFNKIHVDYYGSPTPLQQLASFATPEAQVVIITPYDRSAMQAIEKAIRDADLGINPTSDGAIIRIVLPELTQERRRQYIKMARTKAEDARISVSNIRRRAKEELDRIGRDGEAGQADVVRAEQQLEHVTKRHVDRIDELLRNKE
jgi:ribosome recycling factor